MQFKLVRYDAARAALEQAHSVDDAKDIRDKASALEAYARQKNDVVLERWVSEIKLRAIIRIGEISRTLEKVVTTGPSSVRLPSGGKPKAEVLKDAGISTSSAHRAEQLSDHKVALEAYFNKKQKQGQPVKYTEALTAVTADAREKKAADLLHRKAPAYAAGLHVGDFRELAAQIPDESVELVFTDPPYDKDSIALYEAAAETAARILKPGGSMIAYSGQRHLPQVLAGMSKHLRYWWTIAGVHGGGNQILNKLGIRCGWKPLVWFVKGTRGDVQNVVLDVVIGEREKAHHEWQQAESEASYYIEKLTSKSGLVVDFFAGGGTTLVAAQELGRPWIAFEIDPAAAASATDRLQKIRT